MTKRSKNLGLLLPTADEDAAIAAGLAQDADTMEDSERAILSRLGIPDPYLEHES